MSLEGKVALITGGSGGLGSAISQKLASLGAKTVINYYGSTYLLKAEQLVAEILEDGGQAFAIEADITSESEVNELIGQTEDFYGSLDILVNCAGITIDDLAWKIKKNDLEKVLAVNLVGASLTIKEALKGMLPRGYGRIVNISSVAGLLGVRGASAYSASKAGLIGLSKAIAREVARKGITVNVICPGYYDAGILRQVNEKILQDVIKQVPINRLGKPQELAAAVAYLVSDEAGYVTGTVLRVDGGLAM
jgi:3-oxoacyl-[acyl-carrier protein] reductase